MSQPSSPADTDALLCQVSQGNDLALQQLLSQHRQRLRQMISMRMDPRLAARIDASDVVQETFMQAASQLPQDLLERPLPFYPWLRQLAWQRLQRLHHRHVTAQRRSVTREQAASMMLSDSSIVPLAQRIHRGATALSSPTPSAIASSVELQQRVRTALQELSEGDREILVLRFLEQLSPTEIAAVLDIAAGTVRVRQLRALQRLQTRLSVSDQNPLIQAD